MSTRRNHFIITKLTTRSASSARRSSFLIVDFFCSTRRQRKFSYCQFSRNLKIPERNPPPVRLDITLKSVRMSPIAALKSSSQSSNRSDDMLSPTHCHETNRYRTRMCSALSLASASQTRVAPIQNCGGRF